MARRIALAAVLGFVLGAARLRAAVEVPSVPPRCEPVGFGEPPRHWLGCGGGKEPGRALAPDELLALGLPVDLNAAGARELAFVPGLSPPLAAEVVRDRDRNGPYRTIDELLRVRGVGPKRLAAARPHLFVSAR